MAMKLEIYLKRTDQSMKDWMAANDITKASDLLPRCQYLGLAVGPLDVALAAQILAPVPVPVEPVPLVSPERSKKKKKGDETETPDTSE